MSKLSKDSSGLVLILLIIAGVVTFAYIALQNFLKSERGQNLQETTNKVIDTIDTSEEALEENLIDKITQ